VFVDFVKKNFFLNYVSVAGRKVGSACEEFEDNEGVVYWVSVSESSHDGLPGSSQISK